MYRNNADSSFCFINRLNGALHDELQQPGEHEPTSAILNYCKRKVRNPRTLWEKKKLNLLYLFSPQFLRPYVAILTLVGLNPICTDMSNVRACCSYVQALMVLCVLLVGYVLRYLCGYR